MGEALNHPEKKTTPILGNTCPWKTLSVRPRRPQTLSSKKHTETNISIYGFTTNMKSRSLNRCKKLHGFQIFVSSLLHQDCTRVD